MAKQFDTTNRGEFYREEDKKNPNGPDYTGSLDVNGAPHRLAGWIKTSKRQASFYHLRSSRRTERSSRRRPSLTSMMIFLCEERMTFKSKVSESIEVEGSVRSFQDLDDAEISLLIAALQEIAAYRAQLPELDSPRRDARLISEAEANER